MPFIANFKNITLFTPYRREDEKAKCTLPLFVLLIVFLVRSTGKAVNKMCEDDLGRKYPEFKEPLRIGFPLLFCQEMKKRDMVYRDKWVPRNHKNDPNDPELRKMMKEKDLILTRDNQWTFTGKTKDYLMKHNAW